MAPATGSPYDTSQTRRRRRRSKPSAPPPPILQPMERLIPIVTSTLPSVSAASTPQAVQHSFDAQPCLLYPPSMEGVPPALNTTISPNAVPAKNNTAPTPTASPSTTATASLLPKHPEV
ncbi:hypothetical protein B0H17DRAFT_1136081 [Mycena rosella]|uniref:Uncharacterized protein n=1 Tax=Mycena rosella TaxID=1033263 RepID=A0AAD7DBQ4_MYCRO|nr:hypothetical protein B0H17DRAFT_1136081 [Mycena rosella]